MTRLQKTLILPLLFIALTLPLSLLGSDKKENDPNVLLDKKAPDLVGKDADGKGLIKLNNLLTEFSFKKDANGKFVEENGKFVPEVRRNIVVLNFFSVTCIPCIKEIPTYNKLAKKYESKAKMIFVNIDTDVSIPKIQKFIQKRQIEVPMMLPNQKNAITSYKVYSLPRLVIISPDGKVAHIIKGFKEDLAAQLSEIIDELLKKTA